MIKLVYNRAMGNSDQPTPPHKEWEENAMLRPHLGANLLNQNVGFDQ